MRQLTELGSITPSQESAEKTVDSAPHIILGLRGLTHSNRIRPFHIAILTRSRVAGIKQVIQGLTDHINMHAPQQFLFTWFDGKNDEKTTMESAMHIISNYTMPYDAVVTIGGLATQTAARAALLLNIRMPIIFTSISHPSHLGIMYSGTQGRHNITGIAVNDTEYNTPVSMLQTLKKGVKSVLLPYDPLTAGMHQRIAEMARLFLTRNIQIHVLPVQKTELVTSQIASFIHHIDTVITMRDEIVVNHMPNIITLCNDFGVTIFSSDLASVEQGAAIGFSPKETTQGMEAAQYLLLIFKENARPEELPIKEVPVVHFVGINEASLDKQGITLSPQELDTIKNKVLYKKE
jgi:ABC-type uncharacterized transport system substrate-binding protein